MFWPPSLGQAIGFISIQKHNLKGTDGQLIFGNREKYLEDSYRKLYIEYEQAKNRDGLLDFNDMLLWTYSLFKSYPATLGRYRSKFNHFLVDEFQDINYAQYEIIRLLAAPPNNLFVVGDDYQSIYGWRNASPSFIIDFPKCWPGTRTYFLTTNYRSTPQIVHASNLLIKNNRNQLWKTCVSLRPSGAGIQILSSGDEDAEAKTVARIIKRLSRHMNFENIAVPYRTNAQSRAFEDAFAAAGIPYVVVGGKSFYDLFEISSVIHYMKAIIVGNENSLRRIVYVPIRYITKSAIDQIANWGRSYNYSLPSALFHPKCPLPRDWHQRRNLQEFIETLTILRDAASHRPNVFIRRLREVTHFDDYLRQNCASEDGSDDEKVENLDMLERAASQFATCHDFLEHLKCIEDSSVGKPKISANTECRMGATGLISGKQESISHVQGVQLMTIHKAKGTEYQVVFVAGVSENILPHKRALKVDKDGGVIPESLDEERRLMYVAMTRAKDQLYISSISNYMNKKVGPSVFLNEIEE